MVEMELWRLIINENREEQVIILKETKGKRAFPIIIGIYEAAAIDRKLKDIKAARPLTHDLIINFLEAINSKITKVVIYDLKKNTFYARIYISTNGKEKEIDSRPSDAIVLAVHLKSPILVDEKILDEVGTTAEEESSSE
jgi:bifunctional DNase/RNase